MAADEAYFATVAVVWNLTFNIQIKFSQASSLVWTHQINFENMMDINKKYKIR